MKHVDEYRDGALATTLSALIDAAVSRSWTIMEICGGQTHTIVKSGLESLLPESVTLVHGPGCPVCVTPLEMIDKALHIAALPGVIFTSFGDMLRVPGSSKDLLSLKAAGADVRIVYSPLDALTVAQENPGKKVVFFGVGFETTAPATALAVRRAKESGLNNFFLLSSHVLVPPAMRAILSSPQNRIQAFLAAGHVCTVTGYGEYYSIAERYRVPVVVTGFEPVDILQGIYMAVKQLEQGRHEVENQYRRSVKREGNASARSLLSEVFEPVDRSWRGIGRIPMSGLTLRDEFSHLDAERQFEISSLAVEESSLCNAGLVLQGLKKPTECPSFGNACTPERPLGAPMVSSEGACAAYYHYRLGGRAL